MEYKNCYGKLVNTTVSTDGWGKELNKEQVYVVTRYLDRDSETVGIYPLRDDERVEDILSTQPMSNEVYTKDLVEIKI